MREKKELSLEQPNLFVGHLHFLVEAYKPSYYWFEVKLPDF